MSKRNKSTSKSVPLPTPESRGVRVVRNTQMFHVQVDESLYRFLQLMVSNRDFRAQVDRILNKMI